MDRRIAGWLKAAVARASRKKRLRSFSSELIPGCTGNDKRDQIISAGPQRCACVAQPAREFLHYKLGVQLRDLVEWPSSSKKIPLV